ncbi:MAG: hypothetical protein ABIP71_07410 [Verrucomicrobiota bacterium]
MKSRFILYRRGEIFYCEDYNTGKQQSLRTRDEAEAKTLLAVKNEANRQPAMNLQIAPVYLQHADPALATRAWQDIMERVVARAYSKKAKVVVPSLEEFEKKIIQMPDSVAEGSNPALAAG